MQRALNVLQMSSEEVEKYVQDAFTSNPLLQFDASEQSSLVSSLNKKNLGIIFTENDGSFSVRSAYGDEGYFDSLSTSQSEESFYDSLKSQINTSAVDDKFHRRLCCYLIDCLDAKGYCSEDVSEIAEKLGIPVNTVEAALYSIQELEPAGVGARGLSECLLIQLARTEYFSDTTIHAVKYYLEYVAANDIDSLSEELHISRREAEKTVAVIRALNPIPSSGFFTGDAPQYIISDATIYTDGGDIVVELNRHSFPHVSLSTDYDAYIGNDEYGDMQDYLQEKMQDAVNIVSDLNSRYDTVLRVITEIVNIQREYITGAGPLVPMTMVSVASRLGLSASTVSRTAKNKYVTVFGKAIPLKSFFSAQSVSAGYSIDAVKTTIKHIIELENKDSPLSDQALCDALAAMGITVSRRSVALYRSSMNIPTKGKRKTAKYKEKT